MVIIPLQGYASAETFYFGVEQEELTEVSIAFDDIQFEQWNLINTTTTITTATTFSSSTTSQNSSQKTLSFNEFKLIIFCFLLIIMK